MNHEAQDESWGSLCEALRGRLSKVAGPWLPDVIQEAVLDLVVARQKGARIRDEVGFCVCVAKRRLADRRRRLLREASGLDLEALMVVGVSAADWAERLRAAGVSLSTQACELLRRIESGYRGNRRLAECLGRDVKSIREQRWRLQRLLRRLFVEIHGVPPPC